MFLWLYPSGIIPSSTRKPSSDPYENLQVDSICFNGSKPEFVPELFLCPGTPRWGEDQSQGCALGSSWREGRGMGLGWWELSLPRNYSKTIPQILKDKLRLLLSSSVTSVLVSCRGLSPNHDLGSAPWDHVWSLIPQNTQSSWDLPGEITLILDSPRKKNPTPHENVPAPPFNSTNKYFNSKNTSSLKISPPREIIKWFLGKKMALCLKHNCHCRL